MDVICDVRSPSEYTEDHVPGAINYPVLSDSERAIVGTMYKQTSPFAARREGAALVADNLAKILRDPRWAELPPDANVLVYCWRGGDRSLSLAHTLSRVGWNIFIVDAGYKGYRKSVRQALQEVPDYQFHMIGGPTGSAKGLFLESLESLGAQVLDLEGAANHKGSVLGESVHAPQPSQKLFETEISRKIKGFSRELPIFVEDESYMVGNLHLPTPLQKAIRHAPRTILSLPRKERVKWTRSQYEYFETTHTHVLREKMDKLIPLRGHELVNRWHVMVDEKKWDALVDDLLEFHYDPAYAKAAKRLGKHESMRPPENVIDLKTCTASEYADRAQELLLACDCNEWQKQ